VFFEIELPHFVTDFLYYTLDMIFCVMQTLALILRDLL